MLLLCLAYNTTHVIVRLADTHNGCFHQAHNYLLASVKYMFIANRYVKVISHSRLCFTTGVKKAMVCAILSVGWCI